MRRVLLALMMLAVAGAAWAQDGDFTEVMQQANRAYAAEDYDAAEALYSGLLADGVRHPALYFNLGTTYQQLGRTGLALASYRMAQLAMPRDALLSARIAQIQGERQDVQGEETVWIDRLGTAASGLMTTAELSVLTFVLWTGWFGLAALTVMRPSWRETLRSMLLVFAVVVLVMVLFLGSRLYVETRRPPAVVVTERVPVLSGPDERYLLLYELSEAAEMRVVERQGTWRRVVLPDGRRGWLDADAVAVISWRP